MNVAALSKCKLCDDIDVLRCHKFGFWATTISSWCKALMTQRMITYKASPPAVQTRLVHRRQHSPDRPWYRHLPRQRTCAGRSMCTHRKHQTGSSSHQNTNTRAPRTKEGPATYFWCCHHLRACLCHAFDMQHTVCSPKANGWRLSAKKAASG